MCRIYKVEEERIRVGSDISSWRRMNQGWVGCIMLRKNGSGLGRIYQVEEERIRVGSDIYQFEKNGSGLGRIYQVLEELIRVGSDILV